MYRIQDARNIMKTSGAGDAVNGCCAECVSDFSTNQAHLEGQALRTLKHIRSLRSLFCSSLLPAPMSFAKLTIFALGRNHARTCGQKTLPSLEILGLKSAKTLCAHEVVMVHCLAPMTL